MSWLPGLPLLEDLRRRFRGGAELEREIDDELRFHLEMRTRANLAAGAPPGEAREDALRRFGDLERIRDQCREAGRREAADELGARALKLFIWLIVAGGIFMRLKIPVVPIQQIGDICVFIAVLWRLLIFGRERRSAPGPALAPGDDHPGILGERLDAPIQPFDRHGRTPVERIIETNPEDAD
jgi:hypothetical protein